MTLKAKPQERGMVLLAVIGILIVVSILVPLMVFYTQREAIWTNKQARNTTAFHQAEAGIEKGYMAISQSTGNWRSLQSGYPLPGYQCDVAYTDIPGGRYCIQITSGPETEQATVISVGQDDMKKETRAIKAVYSNATLGGIAIYSGNGVHVSGGVTVEWGAVVSPQNITLASALSYPQFHSSGSISPFCMDPNTATCDAGCCQWHAYSPNIPPQPVIDIKFYKSSAQATGTYYDTPQSWSSVTSTTGWTYFVDNNLNLSAPGLDILGTLIVTGNLTTNNGSWGKGGRAMPVPRKAWKQYCNDWTHYRTFDTTLTGFPTMSSSYLSDASLTYDPYPPNKMAVDGMMYVKGNLSVGGGGGQTDVHGAFYVVGTSTVGAKSGVTVYYDDNVAKNLHVTKIILNRESWRDILTPWPSSLP